MAGTPLALVTSLDPNLDDPSEKYGRILAQVVKYNPDGSTTDVNAAMLASGLVVAYNPGARPTSTSRIQPMAMQKARKVTVRPGAHVKSSKAPNNFGRGAPLKLPGAGKGGKVSRKGSGGSGCKR